MLPRVPNVPCACCGYETISQGSDYEICPICFWEDDGYGDREPDVRHGGPNNVSLNTARLNFLTFGAAEHKDLPHVRQPRESDRRGRVFVLENGRVVERRR